VVLDGEQDKAPGVGLEERLVVLVVDDDVVLGGNDGLGVKEKTKRERKKAREKVRRWCDHTVQAKE